MKAIKKFPKKDLVDYSKPELISLLTAIEEQYNSKSERLKHIVTKLSRAKVRIQTQKQRLQHMRKRIVELTPKQGPEKNLVEVKQTE
jgi:predicted nuclease with TOPRIM domain